MKTIGEALRTTCDGGAESPRDGRSSSGQALKSRAPQLERPIYTRSGVHDLVVVDLLGGGNLPVCLLETGADLSFR